MIRRHFALRAVLPVVVLSAAVAAFVASPASATEPIKKTCEDKKGTFLFWPKGHGKLSPAGRHSDFETNRTPHLHLFGGIHSKDFPWERESDDPFDSGGLLASADANGTGGFALAPRCAQQISDDSPGKVANRVKKATAVNVQCDFRGKLTYYFRGLASGGARLDAVMNDGRTIVTAKTKPSGSTIVFNDKFCDAKRAPK